MDPLPAYSDHLDPSLYYPPQYASTELQPQAYQTLQPIQNGQLGSIYQNPGQKQLYPIVDSIVEPIQHVDHQQCVAVHKSQHVQETAHVPGIVPSASPSSSRSTSTTAHSNQQSHSTFKWLEGNFQFRSHVSISRSTIYELYQKFCSQNQFIAVCKATFGKIIRIKFPKVKSKRLGARGQSKYHYYNITFKDERKRCSMLLSSSTDDSAQSQSIPRNTSTFQPVDPYLAPPTDPYNPWYQQPTLTELTPWNPEPRIEASQGFTKKSHSKTCNSGATNCRLTIFSNRHTVLDSYSHFNLNENDYHAIIQSMLSYMRIPVNQQPLNNDKFVFINLYKIHCQCLIDSALSGNYAQMRHYLMHFWQQLPRHVTIYVSVMHSLDSHMYSLLEDIYVSSVDSQLDNLKRLNTIAYLIPIWLKKTFEYVPFEGECWDTVHHQNQRKMGNSLMNIGEIKVEEAVKWSFRIKFKVNFIMAVKKLNLSNIPEMVRHLLRAFDAIYQITPLVTSTSYDIDSSIFEHLNPQEVYINTCRATHHLFHQTQSMLWSTLLKQFRCLLVSLETKVAQSNESLESSEGSESAVTGQLLIDELDRMVFSVQDTMNQEQFFWNSPRPTPNHHRLYASMSLLFVRLFDDLLHWLAVEQLLTVQDAELVDEFVDSENEAEDEPGFYENYSNGFYRADQYESESTEPKDPEMLSQLYLLLMSMQSYLMEICQTVQRKSRFGADAGAEIKENSW